MKLTAPISFTRPANQQDVMLFTKHLSTMVTAGIPIVDALSTLQDQAKTVGFKKVIQSILKNVENGQSLAKSLAKHPLVFDEFYVSLIEVSEQSGTLDENLNFIAKQLAKNYGLKKKIQSEMLYPTILVIAVILVGGFISFFVLPQLVNFFESFDIELPLTTKILLFFARTMRDYGVVIFAALAGVFVGLRFLTRLPSVRPHWDSFLLKVPFIGKLISDAQLAQFCRNLGVLLKSGVPISQSLKVTANTLNNRRFRNDLLKIETLLEGGKSIGDAIDKGKFGEFPPLVSKMIRVGEKTGKLDESLLYLGDFYEEEIDNFSKNFTVVLEPILLLVIGLLIGFVALAIITPIYELTGSVRG